MFKLFALANQIILVSDKVFPSTIILLISTKPQIASGKVTDLREMVTKVNDTGFVALNKILLLEGLH